MEACGAAVGAIQELGPSAADRGAGWQAGARLRSRGSLSLTCLPGGWSGGQQTATRVWLPPAPEIAGAIDQTALSMAHPSGHLRNTRDCAGQGAGSRREARRGPGRGLCCWVRGSHPDKLRGSVPGAFTGQSWG